jgi:DNA-directed RNA polymerase subunit H (RpoH/RPB5)
MHNLLNNDPEMSTAAAAVGALTEVIKKSKGMEEQTQFKFV